MDRIDTATVRQTRYGWTVYLTTAGGFEFADSTWNSALGAFNRASEFVMRDGSGGAA